jgi:hypothetical protein
MRRGFRPTDSALPIVARNFPEIWPILEDGVLSQDAAKVRERIDHAVSADQGTGINDGIASDLDPITDNCTELTKTSLDDCFLVVNRDFLSVQAEIGKDYSGTQMRFVPEDRIAHVTEMGDLHVVEDQAILELTGVAQNDAVPDNDVFSDVTTRSNLASLTNPGWSFNRCAGFDHGPFTDKDRVADE